MLLLVMLIFSITCTNTTSCVYQMLTFILQFKQEPAYACVIVLIKVGFVAWMFSSFIGLVTSLKSFSYEIQIILPEPFDNYERPKFVIFNCYFDEMYTYSWNENACEFFMWLVWGILKILEK